MPGVEGNKLQCSMVKSVWWKIDRSYSKTKSNKSQHSTLVLIVEIVTGDLNHDSLHISYMGSRIRII